MRPRLIERLRACAAACSLVLAACGGGSGGGGGNPAPTQKFYPASTAVPVTGPDVAGGAPFDALMTRPLKDNDAPGATLAIAKDGRLVFAKGYGYADFEARQLTQPDAIHAGITTALSAGLDGPGDLYAQFPSPNLPPSTP